MTKYIATFYSHFGAIRYVRELKQQGIIGRTMPVPRNLSSSCGTCVMYESESGFVEDNHDEIEQIVKVTGESYISVYNACEG